jgi:hypothetical protein
MADREAKSSLNSQLVSVPDEKAHLNVIVLYTCTNDTHKDDCLINQENDPMNFFQTVFQETRQIYLRHGKCHNYLLHFSIWQEASFSILHLKRGKSSLKKFIIQILGRTLPTNHRLNLVLLNLSREIMPFMSSGRQEHRKNILSMLSLS